MLARKIIKFISVLSILRSAISEYAPDRMSIHGISFKNNMIDSAADLSYVFIGDIIEYQVNLYGLSNPTHVTTMGLFYFSKKDKVFTGCRNIDNHSGELSYSNKDKTLYLIPANSKVPKGSTKCPMLDEDQMEQESNRCVK